MFWNDKVGDIISVLQSGGLILYPTDTIWGIGCDATNEEAVSKVYDLKKRDADKGLILLVDSVEMLSHYVPAIHPKIDMLLQFHTRPLTVVYDKARNLPKNLMAENGSVAIRIVQDAFCKNLIHHFGKPIVSTSANTSGDPAPPNFGSIGFEIIRGVDYVVKFRQDEKHTGDPSVIVRLGADEELEYLRE